MLIQMPDGQWEDGSMVRRVSADPAPWAEKGALVTVDFHDEPAGLSFSCATLEEAKALRDELAAKVNGAWEVRAGLTD